MILQACFLEEEKPETFSCAWWWRAFMNLFWAIGMSFSLAKNEQMSNKVGEKIDSQKSFFYEEKLRLTPLQPQQNGQFRALFVAGRTKKGGVIGKTTDFHPEWIVPRRGGGGPAHWRCGMPHQPTWTPCGCMHQRRRVWKGAVEGKH